MNVEIAQRLADRRKQAGLSQEALAEQLGVSRQAVSKWERSESSPDTDNLIALAQLYGVSLDDLLYVDDEIRDDVTFEAADRAVKKEAGQPRPDAASAAESAPSSDDYFAPQDADPVSSSKKSKVHVGFSGVHVLDGDDYVHVSWRDGVHVKDSVNGEEVHVGWDGIHVKEGRGKGDGRRAATEARVNGSDPKERDGQAAQAWYGKDDERWRERSDRHRRAYEERQQSRERRRSERDGGGEWVSVTDEGVAGSDGEGNEFVMNDCGVVVNGEHFDSWRDAKAKYHHGWDNDERWYEPCGYTVYGERFDTMEEARAKYGDEVGRSIPVRKHYLREFEKSWLKFPYPLVVIVVYLLLGILNGAWAMGLFLFLTVPLYYMVGHAIGRKRLAPLVSGAYPIVVVAWFCWMAFVLNQPHPAWVAFLTIPVVEWLVHSLSHWRRDRKRRKAAAANAPVNVEAE